MKANGQYEKGDKITRGPGQSAVVMEDESDEDFHNRTAPQPPLDADGLRLDGPTLEQYVAAGYKEENYPPAGYAKRGA